MNTSKEIFTLEENYVSSNPRARARRIEYSINDNGCWNCVSHTTSKHRGNYPVIRRYDKWMRMSRYVFKLVNGYIDDEKYVMHTCDNPTCINPKHLKLGTPKENSEDMVSKGRNKRGVDKALAKLKEFEVLEIYNSKESCIKLAERYGVSKKTVLNIRHKRIWKHVLPKDGESA